MELPRLLIGATKVFVAHGKTFEAKRISKSTYHLREHGNNVRSRFGTLAEIREDIDHVLTCGVLPRSKVTGF